MKALLNNTIQENETRVGAVAELNESLKPLFPEVAKQFPTVCFQAAEKIMTARVQLKDRKLDNRLQYLMNALIEAELTLTGGQTH